MAYTYSKGWFIQQLKALGISKHPVERRKLELYRTPILRSLYSEQSQKKKPEIVSKKRRY
ncbi:YflJ family protein [Peribacillus deserti]|uniref:DUF2639 domain-containing protein n=1 Tax=Peribacillus deserti TaxID=673318 RepID=A0A2N5M2V3_9BACI|nr:YflJ family protein [Peribacillus deserti]PLT28704.1 DUF2639 domain-containing protein [Peribacillus deserti]